MQNMRIKSVSEINSIHACPLCGQKELSKNKLLAHIKLAHNESFEVLHELFASSSGESEQGQRMPNVQSYHYSCEPCGLRLHAREAMQHHVQLTHEDRSLETLLLHQQILHLPHIECLGCLEVFLDLEEAEKHQKLCKGLHIAASSPSEREVSIEYRDCTKDREDHNKAVVFSYLENCPSDNGAEEPKALEQPEDDKSKLQLRSYTSADHKRKARLLTAQQVLDVFSSNEMTVLDGLPEVPEMGTIYFSRPVIRRVRNVTQSSEVRITVVDNTGLSFGLSNRCVYVLTNSSQTLVECQVFPLPTVKMARTGNLGALPDQLFKLDPKKIYGDQGSYELTEKEMARVVTVFSRIGSQSNEVDIGRKFSRKDLYIVDQQGHIMKNCVASLYYGNKDVLEAGPSQSKKKRKQCSL